ncbi:type II secretion system protein [Macrococcus hajekii]|uniref:Type II secretion system protein n=1 Tax=Macrococcus hajekii TaxID=198482 RepID=A0A4R6BMG7_9STAP|nr:type II secretion system protein [Macrococcus hajekii]TDM02918.1 type II secretion system protein [Macrococcus hajekii]GGB04883.1 hypothetical protein GCM10007190_11280 [Macrococcus hajekii]
MKANKGFLLVDSMLAMSIVVLICMVILPMLQTMQHHYEQAYQEVQHYREFYVEIKGGAQVHEVQRQLCTQQRCIPE